MTEIIITVGWWKNNNIWLHPLATSTTNLVWPNLSSAQGVIAFSLNPRAKEGLAHTVDVERFTELNISGFSPMKFFAEIHTVKVHCPPVFITYLKLKIQRKTFAKPQKFNPANLFSFMVAHRPKWFLVCAAAYGEGVRRVQTNPLSTQDLF